jgi:hypothetical protein
MALAADGKIAATNSVFFDGTVRIWPSSTSIKADQVKVEARSLWGMAFFPNSKSLLLSTWTGMHIIDVVGLKVIRVIDKEGSFPRFDLSPDGKTLAAFGRQERPGFHVAHKNIRLWDLDSGQEWGPIASTPPPDYGLLFSPDGRTLLVQHQDGLRLWELATRQERLYLKGGGASAFSANGRLLFCLVGQQIFVWDLTGRQQGGVLDALPHTPGDLGELWRDLQGSDGGKAYRALWNLAASPRPTVRYIEEKIKTLPALSRKQVRSLVGDLDNEQFVKRQKSMAELTTLGRWPAAELQAVLDKNPSLELRQRVETLLSKIREQPFSKEQILALRLVEVLEQAATPEARRLLERLSTSDKEQFTEPARHALARLASR